MAATKTNTVKAIKRRPKKRIYFGCEFEGIVRRSFYESMRGDLRNFHDLVDVGYDSSITGYGADWVSLEIRTPKLKFDDGVKLMEDIVDYLATCTHAGLFKTNSSCGLHVNISEANCFENVKTTRKFYRNIVKNFDENRIAKMFKRQNNSYCRRLLLPPNAKRNDASIHAYLEKYQDRLEGESAYEHKYLSVALRPCHSVPRRIEFRCLGNSNYQIKTDELHSALEHITTCVTSAFEETIKPKAVNKKCV